jgi:hypothetical protein
MGARIAEEKKPPLGSTLCFPAADILTTFEQKLGSDGRFSRLKDMAGQRAILIILKK